jgi:hypothetical protein
MYKEQSDQARQHETMRQQATTIAMTLVGAVVSLAAASGGALAFLRGSANLPNVSPGFFALYSLLGLFVIGIGRHGRRLSLKHYERNQMHTARSRVYRKRLEDLFPGYRFGDDLRAEARSAHQDEWKRREAGESAVGVISQRLYKLWVDLFNFLNWVGGFLIVIPLIIAALLSWPELTDLAQRVWALVRTI